MAKHSLAQDLMRFYFIMISFKGRFRPRFASFWTFCTNLGAIISANFDKVEPVGFSKGQLWDKVI